MSGFWLGLTAGLFVGVLVGVRFSFVRGMDRGRRLTEIEHGYPSPLTPGTHKAGRRKRWARLNVQRSPTPTPAQPKRPVFYDS